LKEPQKRTNYIPIESPPSTPEPNQEEVEEARSELVEEYNESQRQARIQEENEVKAMQETNPHEKYVDVVANRSPKGKFEMTLMGRPVDLFQLEDYLVFTISPRTNTTLMRYNEVKAMEEVQGYGRNAIVKKKKGSFGFLIIIIIMVVIMLVVGVVFLMYGPQIMQSLGGMFGGMTGK